MDKADACQRLVCAHNVTIGVDPSGQFGGHLDVRRADGSIFRTINENKLIVFDLSLKDAPLRIRGCSWRRRVSTGQVQVHRPLQVMGTTLIATKEGNIVGELARYLVFSTTSVGILRRARGDIDRHFARKAFGSVSVSVQLERVVEHLGKCGFKCARPSVAQVELGQKDDNTQSKDCHGGGSWHGRVGGQNRFPGFVDS